MTTPSPNTVRRFGTTPSMQSHTTPSATSGTNSARMRSRRPSTGRRSGSRPRLPRRTTASATSCTDRARKTRR
jgi:hypothetical protein